MLKSWHFLCNILQLIIKLWLQINHRVKNLSVITHNTNLSSHQHVEQYHQLIFPILLCTADSSTINKNRTQHNGQMTWVYFFIVSVYLFRFVISEHFGGCLNFKNLTMCSCCLVGNGRFCSKSSTVFSTVKICFFLFS